MVLNISELVGRCFSSLRENQMSSGTFWTPAQKTELLAVKRDDLLVGWQNDRQLEQRHSHSRASIL